MKTRRAIIPAYQKLQDAHKQRRETWMRTETRWILKNDCKGIIAERTSFLAATLERVETHSAPEM